MPTESETLALLHNLATALRLCGLPERAQELGSLLAEAQDLKSAASGMPGSERQVAATEDVQHKLLLYRAILAFEGRLKEEAGPFEYEHGTYALGERVSQWAKGDQTLVTGQRSDFKEVAKARHWLFHHTSNAPDGAAVLVKMGKVLQNLQGIAARNSKGATPGTSSTTDGAVEWPWSWPAEADLEPTISVLLQLSAGGMKIPVPKERCLVGRDDTIATVTAALLSGTGTRVLLHGHPGMGKDVVASEVVRSKEAAAAGLQLQAWLQASTDAMLRRQLVDLFNTQLPQVLASVGRGEEEQLAAIRGWLATHNDWLLVLEDATWASSALWTYIPPGTGRLLVTSQSPLSEDHVERQESEGGRQGEQQRPLCVTLAVELQALSVFASLELLCRMSIFSKAKVEGNELEACSSEMELLHICAKAKCEAKFVYALPGENESERIARHKAIVESLLGGGGTKAKDRRKRLGRLQQAQLEYRQLMQHPGLRQFLAEDLGNVPLLVSLCGQLLRSMGSVDELIEHHRRVPLQQQQQAGRNPMTDSHYLGAARSVALLLQRLQSSGEEEWPAALRLLQALALLPSRTTPTSLFYSPDERHVVVPLHDDPPVPSLSPSPSPSDEGSRLRFEEARRLLLYFGLAREAEEGRAPAVHQLVQRVVREQYEDEEKVAVLRQRLRQVLEGRLRGAAEAADFMDTRAVLPCAVWWCVRRDPRRTGLEEELFFQELTAERMLVEGSASQAMAMHEEVLHHRKLLRPSPDIAAGMVNLASSYFALGRLEEAAAMEEGALLLMKEALPPAPDDDIAAAMNNLATSYSALGRHEEAVAMQEEVLQRMERILPPDDPGIATAMHNLALSYNTLGMSEDAVAMQEKVLRLRNRTLAPDHPDIAGAMNNLAQSYYALGRHEDAVLMLEKVLRRRKRILPPDHPGIAVAMGNLAVAYGAEGRHEKEVAMQEEVLKLRKRILPPDHPDTAMAMNNLAVSLLRLGDQSMAGDRRGYFQSAASNARMALEIRLRKLPQGHPGTAASMHTLHTAQAKLAALAYVPVTNAERLRAAKARARRRGRR